MSARGYYKARTPGTLKGAVADLIAANGGPVAAANKCRLGKSALQYASDPNDTRQLPIDVVMVLEAACGKPIVTQFLALESDRILTPIVGCSEPIGAIVARMTTETGELLTASASSIETGKFTRAAAAVLVKEAGDVVTAGAQVLACARLRLEDPNP